MSQTFEERFEPFQATAQLIYDEHIIRYELAKDFVKNKEVLDIACGTGYGSDMLAAAGAKRLIGMDIDKIAVQTASQKYRRENLEFRQGKAEKLELADRSMDIVTSFETIEHLEEPKKYLSEIKRVLKDEGLLIISTPNKKVFQEQNPYHLHEYEREELEKLLKHFFNQVLVIEQHNALASYLHSVHFENNQKYCRMLISNGQAPGYFVVLCSNMPIDLSETLPIASMNGQALAAIHNNPGWKLVNIVYKSVIDVPGMPWLIKQIKKFTSR
jgi:O-antigen biosynthesis protein